MMARCPLDSSSAAATECGRPTQFISSIVISLMVAISIAWTRARPAFQREACQEHFSQSHDHRKSAESRAHTIYFGTCDSQGPELEPGWEPNSTSNEIALTFRASQIFPNGVRYIDRTPK